MRGTSSGGPNWHQPTQSSPSNTSAACAVPARTRSSFCSRCGCGASRWVVSSGWKPMHQQPPKMPLLASTSAANASHVDRSSALIVNPCFSIANSLVEPPRRVNTRVGSGRSQASHPSAWRRPIAGRIASAGDEERPRRPSSSRAVVKRPARSDAESRQVRLRRAAPRRRRRSRARRRPPAPHGLRPHPARRGR